MTDSPDLHCEDCQAALLPEDLVADFGYSDDPEDYIFCPYCMRSKIIISATGEDYKP